MTFKRFVIFLVLALGFATPALASATDASSFISNLASNALTTISDQSLSKDQKQAKLETLFSANVDIPWVGRFVMGRFWKDATDDQKQRYLAAYQQFLILHYTSRFTDYTSGTFKITAAKDDGDNESTISMQLASGDSSSNEQPVLVDYRVRQDAKGFKIFDVIVEGVSLISTQRSEFGSVLNQNGIDYLIQQLQNKSIPVTH